MFISVHPWLIDKTKQKELTPLTPLGVVWIEFAQKLGLVEAMNLEDIAFKLYEEGKNFESKGLFK